MNPERPSKERWTWRCESANYSLKMRALKWWCHNKEALPWSPCYLKYQHLTVYTVLIFLLPENAQKIVFKTRATLITGWWKYADNSSSVRTYVCTSETMWWIWYVYIISHNTTTKSQIRATNLSFVCTIRLFNNSHFSNGVKDLNRVK